MTSTRSTFPSFLRLRGIRASFVFAFVLAVLIPAITITISTTVFGVRSGIERAQEQFRSVATLKAAQIDFWIDGLFSEAARVAQESDVVLLARQALPDSPFPTRREEAVTTLTELFQERSGASQMFDHLFLLDLTGQVIVSTDGVEVGTLYSDLPNFQGMQETPYVHPPIYSEAIGQANVLTFQPIFDRGALLAVLGGSSSLSQLYPLLAERAGLGETGETYLVDTNKRLLTPSRFDGFDIGVTEVNTEGVNATIDQRSSGAGVYNDYRSIMVVGYYQWLPRLGVGLLAEQDRTEVLAPTVATIVGNTIITAVAVIIVIVGGVVIVERRITIPLVKLSDTARRISEGDYQLRVNIDRDDEIGLLSRTFDQMTENIQKRTQDLIRANALAQESARLKSQFLSTMSHELRTPLNAILDFTTIMLQGMSGQIDEKSTHMLQRILANGQRLLQLIDDVLNIAKIESGRLELSQEPFDPRVLATKIQAQLGGLADQKGLSFIVQTDETLPEQFYGDEVRINQIITNLVGNAIKFTDKGEVRLSMGWDQSNWIIRVSDTGIGIPPHAHTLIFEAFRQLDGSSRRVYGGSGLGLAIVRNLVAMMSGTVRVESELGKGSTFIVTLPLPVTSPGQQLATLAMA